MKKQSLKNLKKPWKPGQSGNPAGRPKGSRNVKTIYLEAWKEVVEALKLGKEPDRVPIELIKRGIREGLKGNFPFYKDIMDRVFGKPKQPKQPIEGGLSINITEQERKKEEVKNNASTNNLPKKTA